MVRLSTPPESSCLEIFDLTTPWRNYPWRNYPWRIGAIRTEVEELFGEIIEEMDEEFVDCIEPVVLVPDGITVVAMDLQDDLEERKVQMVRTGEEEQDAGCLVTLDSGADISVLPSHMAALAPGRRDHKG